MWLLICGALEKHLLTYLLTYLLITCIYTNRIRMISEVWRCFHFPACQALVLSFIKLSTNRNCKLNTVISNAWSAALLLVWVSTALHTIQTRSSDVVCLSVRPSVRPSVKRANCDNTEERSVQIFHNIQKTI